MINYPPSVRQSSRQIREYALPHWKSCVYCDKKVHTEMTVEHLIPKSSYDKFGINLKDGVNSLENLIIACRRCNNERQDMFLSKRLLTLNPNPVEHFVDFIKTFNGTIINGIDYGKSLGATMLKLLEFEKQRPELKEFNLDSLIKHFDIFR